MKKADIDAARVLYLKAEHDREAVALLLKAGSTDVICSHLHQAVEKYLKAFLQAHDVEYPCTHDLDALLDLCAGLTGAFEPFRDRLEAFIPYAVMLRYDLDYEPGRDEARQGLALVSEVRANLLCLVPDLVAGSDRTTDQ